jgi:hypothetical protein
MHKQMMFYILCHFRIYIACHVLGCSLYRVDKIVFV